MRSETMRKTGIATIFFGLCLACSLSMTNAAYAEEAVQEGVPTNDAKVVIVDDNSSAATAASEGEAAATAEAGDASTAAQQADNVVADEAATDASDNEAAADGTATAGQAAPEDAADATASDAQDAAASDVQDADQELAAASAAGDLAVEGDPAPAPLAAGDYIIRTALGGSYVVDTQWGSTANGANTQIYTYNGTDAQKWRLSIDADGNYTITNIKSGKVLDLSGARVANGSNINQYTSNGTKAQKWVLTASGDGFVIASALNPKYALDISAGRAADGSNVQLWQANGTAAQRFIFTLLEKGAVVYETPVADGDYVIQAGVGGQYVLDVAWGSKSNGGNVQIYSYNGSEAQKWHLAADASGLYTITNVGSKKVLDVNAGNAWYGSNVQQYTSNSTKAQKWVITEQDGKYKIASAVNPLFVLDVNGARAADGANIQVYFDNGSFAQRFSLVSSTVEVPASSDIADGVYAITSAANKSYVVEVYGGSTANGANVQLHKDNDSNAQRWGIIRNSDNLYSIFNMTSGKMLDVAGGSPLSGANVQQFASNDTVAQRWSIVKGSDGSITFFSALSGLVIDVYGGKIANGSNIQLYASNGTKAQKFNLVSKPVVEERTYTILTTLTPEMAIDVPSASREEGTKLTTFAANDTIAQHIVLKDAGDGSYLMQVVASAKYLTADGNAVVQRANLSHESQKWTAEFVKGGVVFTNVSTGKALAAGSKSPKSGTALAMVAPSNATAKFGLRTASLISDGMYTFTSGASASGRVLDVNNGSWANCANVQIFAANNSNAQKFRVVHVSGDYYRILLSLSNQAIDVQGGSKADGGNVDIYAWNGTDAQLWKPVLTDGGLTFVNKGSGMLLAVAGGADKNGANVNQQKETSKYAQTWLLSGTTLSVGDLNTLVNIVRSVRGGGSVTATWTVDPNAWNGLMNAVHNVWNAGYDVGFIMTDLQTGNSVSLNADKNYYGACTIKAAYITWILQELVDPGYVSLGHVYDRMYPAIHDSENSTYLSLRAEYGSEGFTRWLGEIGLSGGWTWENYAFYTPRQLQLMWTRMTAYDASNAKSVGTWRSLFGNTNWTPIAYELRGNENIVYSKPGWYSGGGAYQTLADSGLIVRPSDYRKYLLTIMGTYNPDDYGIKLEMAIARALDNVIRTAPAA